MNLSKRMIAPSILSADFTRLHEEIQDVEHGECDAVHVDVMDGHFVPNLTIGPPVIRWIRKTTKLPLDVHLMITEPIQSLKDFREAGADWITIHVEACRDVTKTLEAVHSLGAQAGLSLRPKTDVKTLMPYLGLIDFVLVMTVGFVVYTLSAYLLKCQELDYLIGMLKKRRQGRGKVTT